jgi:hypothetical protein
MYNRMERRRVVKTNVESVVFSAAREKYRNINGREKVVKLPRAHQKKINKSSHGLDRKEN